MRLLAIETATEACSVAVCVDGAILEQFEIAPRRHAALVLPMAEALLAKAGVSRRQLDAIAVGRGPGAFTGVRLAIAIAQGLALALDRPIVPVSTLAALAMAGRSHGLPVLALLDARMGEVYGGVFESDDAGLMVATGSEFVAAPAAVPVPERGVVLVGTGAGAYRAVLDARFGAHAQFWLPEALPHAGDVARLAQREFALGRGVDALAAQPIYLRDKVALTLAEQGKPPPG